MVETSIIIPVKNTDYLKKTLRSVLSQTYTNFEIIVVNDNPSNKDFKSFENLSNKIKVFHNNKNIGPALSRAKGIERAQGEFISFLDSDDIFLKEKLKKQIYLMKKYEYDFTYTDYEIINSSGDIIIKNIPIKNKFNYQDYLKSRGIITSSVVTRKKFLHSKILLSTKKFYGEDTLWWLLIMREFDLTVYKIPEVLTYYRKVDTGLSRNIISYSLSIISIYIFDLKINLFKVFYYIPRYILNVINRKIRSKKLQKFKLNL